MEETTSTSSGNTLVSPALSKRSLWMGSLDSSMDEELIAYAFERMGEKVERVKFIQDKATGKRHSGYCFLEFKDQEAAEATMNRVSRKPIPNFPHLTFILAPARSGLERESPHQRRTEYSLFVGNLTDDVREADLLHFFSSRYSTVKEARLCKTPDGVTKGFGFVRFFNEHDQQEALRRMDGVRGLGGRSIYVKLATPKPSPLNSRVRYSDTTNRHEEHQDTYGYYNQQYQTNQYPQTNNPYYGGNTWSGQSYQPYQSQYPQPYQYSSQQQDSPQTLPNTQQMENPEKKETKAEDEELADQETHLDVDKMNEEFISNNEELYSSLEKSRWHFVDYVTTTIDEICMT